MRKPIDFPGRCTVRGRDPGSDGFQISRAVGEELRACFPLFVLIIMSFPTGRPALVSADVPLAGA